MLSRLFDLSVSNAEHNHRECAVVLADAASVRQFLARLERRLAAGISAANKIDRSGAHDAAMESIDGTLRQLWHDVNLLEGMLRPSGDTMHNRILAYDATDREERQAYRRSVSASYDHLNDGYDDYDSEGNRERTRNFPRLNDGYDDYNAEHSAEHNAEHSPDDFGRCADRFTD